MSSTLISCPPCRSPEKCVSGECQLQAEKMRLLGESIQVPLAVMLELSKAKCEHGKGGDEFCRACYMNEPDED